MCICLCSFRRKTVNLGSKRYDRIRVGQLIGFPEYSTVGTQLADLNGIAVFDAVFGNINTSGIHKGGINFFSVYKYTAPFREVASIEIYIGSTVGISDAV